MERSEIEKLIKEEVLYVVSQMKDTLLLQLIGFMEQEKYETDHGIPKSRPEKLENNRHLGIDVPDETESGDVDMDTPTPVLERVSSVKPDGSDE
jgi:hypothetical protein